MRIAHVTNFKEPAISPFFCIFLELVDDWWGSGMVVRICRIIFARTSNIWAPLCSLVFFETFVRDTTTVVNGDSCDAGRAKTDRVFVFWTLAWPEEDGRFGQSAKK